MFNLENAIKTWKRQLRSNSAFEDGDIAELESHLREEIERLKKTELSEEKAFYKASQQLGVPESLGQELYKTRTVRPDATPSWQQSSWINSLLPNYLKIVFRGIRRNKGYTFINITGLALGLAVFMSIGLYILDELNYDRFHTKADQIYRISYKVESEDKEEHYAVAVPGLAPALSREFPEVRQSVRISLPQDLTIKVGEQPFSANRFYHADSTFFNVFDFKLVKGNPATALSGPNKIVLTEEMAQKFFGDGDPVGETITAVYGADYEEDLEVTGIVKGVPETSHFRFNMLTSFETLQELYPVVNDQNWWMRTAYTYIVLPEKYEAGRFERKFPEIVRKYTEDLQQRSGNSYTFELQPLTDIHLHSHLLQELEANGDIRLLYIFGSIGFLILVIGCINFMNLATARAAKRSKEVGVRKTLGANRRQLIRQFYLESFITVFLAGWAAWIILHTTLPLFNQLAGKETAAAAFFKPEMLMIWAIVILLVTIAAGSYPSVVLSSFESAKALKGTVKKGAADILIRKGLVVFQFAISAALLIGLMVIQNQLDYVMTKDLGFEKEQVLVIPVNNSVHERYDSETVKQELSKHSGIRQVAHASHIPTRMLSNNTMVIPEGAPDDQTKSITLSIVSPSLKETLGLELKEGRSFFAEIAGDSTAFILNEAAVDYFGWRDPIGKNFKNVETGEAEGQVIGVYKNFHVQSLHQNIEPVVFRTTPESRYRYTILRLDSSSISSALAHSENIWSEFNPDTPFEYFFLDEQYQNLYQQEKQLGRLIGICSFLAFFIACLGLFGLATHAAEQRTKEIGIRKVLGASAVHLMMLLSKDMVKLVFVGFILAVPIIYIVMENWLQQFAYQTEISWINFLLAGFVTLFIALAAVSSQSIKVALTNPVKSLRSE